MRRLLLVVALGGGCWLASALADAAVPRYPLRILTLAGINIILAVSLNLINGITGQFSIGHAGFMAIGAYGAAWLSETMGTSVRAALPFLPGDAADAVLVLVCLAFGGLLAAIGGLAVGIPSLRLRGDYLAIVTLGFGEIIRVFILNIDAIGGARGYTGIPNLAGFGWVLFAAILTVLLTCNIAQSSFGRTLLAVREDEIAAEAMGVDTTRAKVMSFVISSTMAGVAGGLFAFYNMYLHTNSFTFIKSIEFIIMIVIGGLGSILGAVVGAVLYIVLTEGLRAFEQYRMVLFSVLLVLIMIYRPQGLLGAVDFFEMAAALVPLLELSDVTMQFGGLVAVGNVSLTLPPGALYGLIGPNGAGKTTLFNVITGVYAPTRGEVLFEGRSIAGRPPHRISAAGIARTFQNIRLFGALSVLDNVKVAFDRKQEAGVLSAMFRGATHTREEARIDREARELLSIFKLAELAEEPARSLPYGLQRRLEIARAMATRPRVLCLDEPAAGMNPYEAKELMELIRWIRDQFSLTILLVEHNMKVVMGVCEKVHVLDYGCTIALGTPAEIQADPRVIEAYLGGA